MRRFLIGILVFVLVALSLQTAVGQEAAILEWAVGYNGGAGEDAAWGLAVDDVGNVYVTGDSRGEENLDFATVKYDPAGIRLWVTRFDAGATDQALALALDDSGVYVTGHSFSEETLADFTTIKYSLEGDEIWVASYDGSGVSQDVAYAIGVDADGGVYVAGQSVDTDSGLSYMTTVKYSPDGDELWVARHEGVDFSESGVALIVASSGDVYVTGEPYATIKYGADGSEQWVSTFADGSPGGAVLATDADGNVLVTKKGFVTAKYSPEGVEIWSVAYDGLVAGQNEGLAIATDAGGNVYVTGSLAIARQETDLVVVKYSPEGEVLWVGQYDGPAGARDAGSEIKADSEGNVYVGGTSDSIDPGGGPEADYVILKYSPEGAEVWVVRFDGLLKTSDRIAGLEIDGNGNIFVTGQSGTLAGLDYTTIKYSQGEAPPVTPSPVAPLVSQSPTPEESPLNGGGDEDGSGSSSTLAPIVIIAGSMAVAAGGFIFWRRRLSSAR